jgi:hypothetical protein
MHNHIRLICEEPQRTPERAIGSPVVYDMAEDTKAIADMLRYLHSLGWKTVSTWRI